MTLPESLTELLAHLDGVGYGDLYLDRASMASQGPAARGPATRGPATRDPAERVATMAPGAEPAQVSLLGDEPTPGVPTDPAERLRVLVEVRDEAMGCTACRLAEGRQHVVFSDGDPTADLMFIGEGPGAEEDRRGLPFVGAAGQLLDKIIQAIELERSQVYIANIVKCRPPGNRDPQADEVAACRRYLEQQIDLVQPKVIVLLGKVAAQTLLDTKTSLGRMRGRWWQVRGVETRVTYHPAALLRSSSWKRPTWEDMQLVRDRVRELAGGR